MTEQETKTLQALRFMGYNDLREISKSELDLSFRALSYRMNPETATIERYKDGKDYMLLLEYYNYLSDIKRTNETIRNILNPEEKTYDFQDEKPEPEVKENIDNQQTENVNPNINIEAEQNGFAYQNVQVVDKPSILFIILSLIIPLFGIFMFIFNRRITPKSAKWYLIAGIIGYIVDLVLTSIFYYQMLGEAL